MPSDIEALRMMALFGDLSSEHLQHLAERVRRRHFAAGDVIFQKGDPGIALFLIREGEVKITELSPTNQEIALAVLRPGDSFGELALLDDGPRSATATATEPTEALALYREEFLAYVELEPVVMRSLLRSLAAIIRRTNDRLSDTLLDVNRRLSKVLIDLADHYGVEMLEGILIDRTVTLASLAELVGLHPTEVDHPFRNLQYEDIVRVEGDRITIRRIEDLRRWL